MAASDGSSNGNRLDGKVAIITGGASGIGEETVRQFVRHGARVVIADVQDEKGAAIVSSLGLERCTYVHCDVTDEQQVESLVDSTVRTHGCLDVVFCNAGIASLSKQDVLGFDVGNYERLFAVNVRGFVLFVKHSARAMVAGGRNGSIICTGSVTGEMGTPIYTDYTMSKHAVLGLMRSASKQLGQYGVRVNCVSPSAVATPLVCSLYELETDEVERAFASSSCMKGVLKAKHVADAAVFLASDESEFINGHNLVVDGGQNFK